MSDGAGGFTSIDMDALFAATPAQQKEMLNHALYPKVYNMQPEFADAITGFLLERENDELMNLQVHRGGPVLCRVLTSLVSLTIRLFRPGSRKP